MHQRGKTGRAVVACMEIREKCTRESQAVPGRQLVVEWQDPIINDSKNVKQLLSYACICLQGDFLLVFISVCRHIDCRQGSAVERFRRIDDLNRGKTVF